MAKRFMYVCLGILALAVAFHLGAQYGHADYVHHHDTVIIGMTLGGDYLLDNGELWTWNSSQGLQLHVDTDLLASSGVPVSQIKFIESGDTFITTNDELWHYDYLGWHNCGSPPAGPVATEPTTWSRIKAEFGD